MNAAGSLYFADEGYLTWQKNLVEPYLKQCQKYAYFHSYDGAAIFYQQYLAAGADSASLQKSTTRLFIIFCSMAVPFIS